jgi:hypothetical protein
MKRYFRLLSLALLFVAFFAVSGLKAQDSSSMTGTVTDTTGAVVPGTVVKLSNPLTGVSYTQTTNGQGSYRFANVPPAEGYVVEFSHSGFASVQVSKVVLSVGTTRTQDAKLLAGSSETIQVTSSGAVTLNTTDATIGNSVDVQSLNSLPIQDRTNGIQVLFNFQPGVDNTQLGGSGSVTGARTDQSSVTIDGLDVNDIAAGGAFTIIGGAPVDSVDQFTGSVAGLVPSVGTGSGGQFQLVTKSGTNKFHGNINEYHRDTTTAANTYFNNDVGLPRTPLIRNQFGGNIGGPILKDKLFFFFDFADSRIIQSAAAEPTVPIPALYSSTPTLNYINNNSGCKSSSRLNTTPSCISTLSASQVAALDPNGVGFDAPLLAFLKTRYPAPNDPTRGDGVNTEGLRFTSPTPNFDTTYVGRIDYNLTPTQKIYGRFTINRANSVYSLPQFPGDPNSTTEIDRSYAYVLSHVWTIGKNKVNQFYYGDNISKLSFPAGDFQTSPNVYSFTGLSNPYGTQNSQKRRVPIPVVRDDFNWQVKTHSLSFGGLFKFIKTNSNSINDYNFVGVGATGTALGGGLSASLRPSTINASSTAKNDYDRLFSTSLGVIGDISTNFNYTSAGTAVPGGTGGPRAYRFFETEAYVGDTWKVNKQLTLTYGIRYQVYSVPYEVHGAESISQITGLTPHQSTFDQYFQQRLTQNAAGIYGQGTLPFFQEVLGGKANNGPSSYSPSYEDLAPRVAFAYNPKWSPKTVFNGSAAIVYDRTVINAINFLQDQLSFLFYNNNTNQFGSGSPSGSLAVDPRLGTNLAYASSNNPVALPIKAPYTPYVSGGSGYGFANGQEGFVIDPGLKDPYTIDFNVGIQRELPDRIIVKLNYASRLGRRLLADADASQVLNFPDNVSGQNLSQAFASLTTQLRAGVDPTTATGLTAAPWFENILGPGLGTSNGFANNTSLAAYLVGQLGNRGDITDSLNTLAAYGLLPENVGIPSQFGTQAYLTNKGSSNYNALLLTVSKNLSHGLKYDFNYTWSHSIDNNSQAANNNALYNVTGILCDITRPRACRGNSDFDVRQEISSDFLYDLPFGRGRMFGANDSLLVEEVLGGWSVSGLPSYRTGLSINPLSYAFLGSFASEDPAIFTGPKSDLKSHVNNVQGTVYNFAGGVNGANKVLAEFRGPIGLEYGQRNIAKGPGAFNLDFGLAKTFPIIPADHVNLVFRADAFNLLNHPSFGTPTLDIVNNVSPFGQITGTSVGARVGQFSLRLEF